MVAAAALMGLLAAPSFRIGTAGFWVAFLAAAALAINLGAAYQQLQAARWIAMWCAYLCAFAYCAGLNAESADGGRDARRVLGAVAFAGTALAAHGLYQTFYTFDLMARAARDEGLSEAIRNRIQSGRAVATFGLPDALSGLLAISLPITFAMARRGDRGGWWRIALHAAVAVQTAGLLATRSAGGFAALALSVTAMLWWRGRTRRGTVGRGLAIALVACALIGAGLLLALRLGGPGAAGEGNPLTLREGNWRVALAIAGEHPLFGAGAGCYGIAFPAHRAWGMNETQFVHNSYLQILSETGAPLAIAAMLGAALFGWWLLNGGAAPFLGAACLTFLVHNTADFTFYVPSVGLTFFCIAGLAVGRGERAGPPAIVPGGAALRRIAALALAAFALLVTRADLSKESARQAVEAHDDARASSLAQQAVSADPFDPESWSLLSHLTYDRAVRAADAAALETAEEQARRAVALDPRTPHHWNHLGRVLLARGDRHGAYIALARAAQLYPIKIEYRQDRDAVGATLSQGRPGPAGAHP